MVELDAVWPFLSALVPLSFRMHTFAEIQTKHLEVATEVCQALQARAWIVQVVSC